MGAIATIGYDKLEPYLNPEDARTLAVQMMPSLVVPKGTVLAQILTGGNAGKYTPYLPAYLADPVAAPVPTEDNTSGVIPAGDYWVAYSYITAAGETLISPAAKVTAAGSKQIAIAQITLPAGATGVNWYISEVAGSGDLRFVVQKANGNSFLLNELPAAGYAHDVPAANTAETVLSASGESTAAGIAVSSFNTDSSGNVIYTTDATVSSAGLLNPGHSTADMYWKGTFLLSELTGYDAGVLTDLNARLMGAGAYQALTF